MSRLDHRTCRKEANSLRRYPLFHEYSININTQYPIFITTKSSSHYQIPNYSAPPDPHTRHLSHPPIPDIYLRTEYSNPNNSPAHHYHQPINNKYFPTPTNHPLPIPEKFVPFHARGDDPEQALTRQGLLGLGFGLFVRTYIDSGPPVSEEVYCI